MSSLVLYCQILFESDNELYCRAIFGITPDMASSDDQTTELNSISSLFAAMIPPNYAADYDPNKVLHPSPSSLPQVVGCLLWLVVL